MKKNIYCERCGKREGIGKCHERISHNKNDFHLCVDCSQIAYKIKDAVTDNNTSLAEGLVRNFSSLPNIPSETLSNWFTEYKTRIGFSPSN
jgi:protein-arginine kinase activator protein McsA